MKKVVSIFLAISIVSMSLMGCYSSTNKTGKRILRQTSSVNSIGTTDQVISNNSQASNISSTIINNSFSSSAVSVLPGVSNNSSVIQQESSDNISSFVNQSNTDITHSDSGESTPSQSISSKTEEVSNTINGVSLSNFQIVYDKSALDYTLRAAQYIQSGIEKATGVRLIMVADEISTIPQENEILVGDTNRSLSQDLDAKTEGFEFAFLAKGGNVAIEGDYFVIAAAAYYFIETFIKQADKGITIPEQETICQPIVEDPEHYFVLIGDGMGPNQINLFDVYDATTMTDYSDGEDLFYGYLFPYQGAARTDSLSGTTDSAASATALATGYKTKNGRVGRDKDGKDILSLTEMAADLGMGTAVMTTESKLGATPASFSAHADNRDDTEVIETSQNALINKYKTLVSGIYDYYTDSELKKLEQTLNITLASLYAQENGSFMMYEEAHIDKHSHNNEMDKAFMSVVRFNLAIGIIMEKAFYNPDTLVIITADHETGGLKKEGDIFEYTSEGHTSQDVPVFAFGKGAECFNGKTIENVQIPKTIASMWGQSLASDTDNQYPSLIK